MGCVRDVAFAEAAALEDANKVLKEEAAGEQAENAVEHGEAQPCQHCDDYCDDCRRLVRTCCSGPRQRQRQSKERQGALGSPASRSASPEAVGRLKSPGDGSEAARPPNQSELRFLGTISPKKQLRSYSLC